MDRELVNSLLHLTELERSHPEAKTKLERELSLFDRLVPQLRGLVSAVSDVKSNEAVLHDTPNPAALSPQETELQTTVSRGAPVMSSTIKKTATHSSAPRYAGGSIPFSRSFFNRSRIIKNP